MDIFYLLQANNLYRAIYDSSKLKLFVVHKWNSGTRQFMDPPWYIYWISTKEYNVAGRTTLLNVYDKYSSQVGANIGTNLINL